jgi:general secretion pathway protein G
MTRMRHTPPRPSRPAGFSLVEIMIVIVLIAVIGAFAINRIGNSRDRANFRLAKSQIESIAAKVDQYEMDVRDLPPDLEALVTAPAGASGWLGPYARAEELRDPFGGTIELRIPGDDGQRFTVISYGADRRPGGESVDADQTAP